MAGHVFSNLLEKVSIKIKGYHKVARSYVCYIPFTIMRIKFVTSRENYYVLISRETLVWVAFFLDVNECSKAPSILSRKKRSHRYWRYYTSAQGRYMFYRMLFDTSQLFFFRRKTNEFLSFYLTAMASSMPTTSFSPTPGNSAVFSCN